MITKIQTPIYNKIQAAKGATNPYSTIKHQPPRHSELVSESNQLPLEQSNLAITKGLIALNQITFVSFGQASSNPVKKAGENFIFTRKLDSKGNPKPVKVSVSREVTEKRPNHVNYLIDGSIPNEPIGSLWMATDNEREILGSKMYLNRKLQDYADSSIVITGLYSWNKDKYRAIGTTLMQYALEESFRQGHEGRMVLNAFNVDDDGTYPTIFYYKMGLRFPDKSDNKEMEHYLKTINSGKYMYLPEHIHSGKMYLPKENIPILLAQTEKTRPVELRQDESNSSYAAIYRMPTYAEKQAGQKPEPLQATIHKSKHGSSKFYEMRLPSEEYQIAKLTLRDPIEEDKLKVPEEFHSYYDDSKYLSWIGVESPKGKYQKIGTELLKQAVIESIREGHGGKLTLYSVRGDMKKENPSVFYYKMGLRFHDEWRNDMMEEYLEEIDYGNNPDIPEKIASGPMYLPEWNVANLLNKGADFG